MNIKDKTTEVLLELGVNMSTKGFNYIVTAMELFHNGWKNEKTTCLYHKIAKIHNTTASRVERCLRHVLQTLMTKQELSLIEKYLDTYNQTNSAHLHKLYYRISKELEG